MRRWLFVSLTITAVLLGIAGYEYTASHASRPAYQDSNEVAFWRDEIRTKGVEAAHAELMSRNASTSDSVQHLDGHRFGRALYEEVGSAGFSTCGMELEGGCVHEFVAAALEASGTPALAALDQRCIERLGPTGAITCQHGFGHGLVGYYGYTEHDLMTALKSCDTLTSADTTTGCYGGALMEYDSRTMSGYVLRPLEPGKPFALCDRLAERYRPACYFWSAQWLLELIGSGHDAAAYASVGATCETARPQYATECFRGLGYFAPPSAHFDARATANLCDAATSNKTFQTACREEAAFSSGLKVD